LLRKSARKLRAIKEKFYFVIQFVHVRQMAVMQSFYPHSAQCFNDIFHISLSLMFYLLQGRAECYMIYNTVALEDVCTEIIFINDFLSHFEVHTWRKNVIQG
jgi:hypothetical protein